MAGVEAGAVEGQHHVTHGKPGVGRRPGRDRQDQDTSANTTVGGFGGAQLLIVEGEPVIAEMAGANQLPDVVPETARAGSPRANTIALRHHQACDPARAIEQRCSELTLALDDIERDEIIENALLTRMSWVIQRRADAGR